MERKQEKNRRDLRVHQKYVASLAAQVCNAEDDDDVVSNPDLTEFLGGFWGVFNGKGAGGAIDA